MSNPKKIEDLDPAERLQDDDLLFASVPNDVSAYVSKKVTLGDIANYVRNGMEPVESGSGGYEMYDVSDSNNDYIFNETISCVAPGSANYPTSYTHHFTHDCEILLGVNTPSSPTNKDDYDYVKIDNMSIHPGLLAVGEQSNYMATVNGSWYVAKFFVKSG